jgi:HAD superfamily hydrolase (TIGR01509 family)
MLQRMETELQAVPGALDAILAVTRPKAVASSSNAPQLEAKLKRTALWDHVQPHVYSADHVTHAKPAPDLFLYAAAQLGIAPRGCLVIEDSVNGVKAARAAGMRVWGFLGGRHMDAQAGARLLDAGAERNIANWKQFSVAFEDAL